MSFTAGQGVLLAVLQTPPYRAVLVGIMSLRTLSGPTQLLRDIP
jgi:hypothetical protein